MQKIKNAAVVAVALIKANVGSVKQYKLIKRL
jgi:hypothetical protein